MAEEHDIEKTVLVSDAEMYACGYAIETDEGMLPTKEGLEAAYKYWNTLTEKEKLFILWIMQAHFRNIVCK